MVGYIGFIVYIDSIVYIVYIVCFVYIVHIVYIDVRSGAAAHLGYIVFLGMAGMLSNAADRMVSYESSWLIVSD
jgi:hypothetical protein